METSLVAPTSGAWGSENTYREDLIIPRLAIVGINSGLSRDGFPEGDILDASSRQTLAKNGEKLPIIPFYTYKDWVENEVLNGGTKQEEEKFYRRIVVDKTNETWPEENVVHGKPIRRYKALNFFCIVPGQEGLPYLVTFQKSGMKAGKLLSTHFQVSGMKNLTPARQVFMLSAKKQTYGRYTWYGWVVEPGRAATQDEMNTAYGWYQTVSKNRENVQVHDTDSEEPAFNG